MANAFAYRWPVIGATPPTHQQMEGLSRVSGIVTTDGATPSITIVHNLSISDDDLARDLPDVSFTAKGATFNDQNVFVAGKTANDITLTTDGDVAVSFGVNIERPTTAVR